MIAIYLVLLVITGYFVFTRIDLIDVAVVMLFTSVLLGLSLLPYLASIPQLREAIVSVGLAKFWPGLIIWAAIAVAVLYRIFAGKKGSGIGGRPGPPFSWCAVRTLHFLAQTRRGGSRTAPTSLMRVEDPGTVEPETSQNPP